MMMGRCDDLLVSQGGLVMKVRRSVADCGADCDEGDERRTPRR